MRMTFNFQTFRIQSPKKEGLQASVIMTFARPRRDFCAAEIHRRSLVTGANGTAIDGRISAGEKLDAMSLRTVGSITGIGY